MTSATQKQHASGLNQLRADIEEQYRQRTPASRQLFERAKSCLPGGVSGNLRFFSPYPLYTNGGEGCVITDVDGNGYIDCFGMNGPLLLGHKNPVISEAVRRADTYGSLPLNPQIMIDAAEAVRDLVPCAERVRFLSTGTEAVIMAVRYARAFTGRNKIIKFLGHYHGQQDQFLFGIDNTTLMFSAGVPESATANTIGLPYLDLEELDALFARDGEDVAAVILDPAMHAGGLWGSDREKLHELKRLCNEQEVLLIFDEVITGCRLAPGGAQEFYGVVPDIATLAKALAGGEKLAAVVGRADIFSVVDPLSDAGTPRVFQSGTVNDGAAALGACIAAVNQYGELGRSGAYDALNSLAEKLRDGLRAAFAAKGIHCHVNQIASMLQLYIAPGKVDFQTAGQLSYEPIELFYLAMINEGVLLSLPTSNHIYLSFSHGQREIDLILDAAHRVLHRHDFGCCRNLAGSR
jgi:glutamate-1-semialdehyde 2,1-aminomutase